MKWQDVCITGKTYQDTIKKKKEAFQAILDEIRDPDYQEAVREFGIEWNSEDELIDIDNHFGDYENGYISGYLKAKKKYENRTAQN